MSQVSILGLFILMIVTPIAVGFSEKENSGFIEVTCIVLGLLCLIGGIFVGE